MPLPFRTALSDYLRIAMLLLAFAALAWLLRLPGFEANILDIEQLQTRVEHGGWRFRGWFIGVAALAATAGFPRIAVCAIAGSLFGPLEGFSVGMAATLMAAAANFYIARLVMRGPVKRRFPNKLALFNKKLKRNGFWWTLWLRLLPVSNATMVNMLCGASRVKFRYFFAATALGYVPESLIFALLGNAAAESSALLFIAAAGLLVTLAGVPFLLRRKTEIMKLEIETSTEELLQEPTPGAPNLTS